MLLALPPGTPRACPVPASGASPGGCVTSQSGGVTAPIPPNGAMNMTFSTGNVNIGGTSTVTPARAKACAVAQRSAGYPAHQTPPRPAHPRDERPGSTTELKILARPPHPVGPKTAPNWVLLPPRPRPDHGRAPLRPAAFTRRARLPPPVRPVCCRPPPGAPPRRARGARPPPPPRPPPCARAQPSLRRFLVCLTPYATRPLLLAHLVHSLTDPGQRVSDEHVYHRVPAELGVHEDHARRLLAHLADDLASSPPSTLTQRLQGGVAPSGATTARSLPSFAT